MLRFPLLSILVLVLLMAVFAFTMDQLGLLPRTADVDFRFGIGHLPVRTVIATWVLEAMALTALFLIVQGRFGSWWLDGLAAGWLGWTFRGPLLVLTATGAARLDPDPWWHMVLAWWVLYSLCGLAAGALARGLHRGSEAGPGGG